MLIESAFSILPEVIAGRGFNKITKEASAVSIFSFALLNTLHAKNIRDPLRFIQLERPYATKAAPLNNTKTRRDCDLFIDYGGSKIGSKELEKYGWRYNNFLEAKFFKSYKKEDGTGTINKNGQDTNASNYSAIFVKDIIRLIALVPEPTIINDKKQKAIKKTASARYFLLLSNQNPKIYLNKFLGPDLLGIFENPKYSSKFSIDLSGKEFKKMAKKIGYEFNKLKLELNKVTCYSHFPVFIDDEQTGNLENENIWMLLLRVDEAKITLNLGNKEIFFEFKSDRTISQSDPDAYKLIREFVSQNMYQISQ